MRLLECVHVEENLCNFGNYSVEHDNHGWRFILGSYIYGDHEFCQLPKNLETKKLVTVVASSLSSSHHTLAPLLTTTSRDILQPFQQISPPHCHQ